MLADVLDVLKDIRQVLQATKCSNRDHLVLAELLPVVVEQLGSALFTTRDALSNPIIEAVVGDISPGQLGGLLSRAESDRVVVGDGLVVRQHLKRDHNQRMWEVVLLLV